MLILFVVVTLRVDKKMESSFVYIKAGILFILFLEAFLGFFLAESKFNLSSQKFQFLLSLSL